MALSKEIFKIFNYESWVHAVSGAMGSAFAMSTFYPLDTVRARLQVEDSKFDNKGTFMVLKQIFEEEGILSLYRGIFPVLESLCISNFVYFYSFHSLKALYNHKTQSAMRDLLLGSIAGIINVLATTPFWVVNTRLKLKGISKSENELNVQYKNLFGGLAFIAQTEGIKGLWAGTVPSLMLVINPAIQFMIYEGIKRKLIKDNVKLNSFTILIIGAIAKTISTLATYPLQLIQTQLRAQKSLTKNQGILMLFRKIYQQNGFKGFYRGLEAKIWQTVLTTALMFAAYEKISVLVRKVLMNDKNCLRNVKLNVA